ncbi:hypothetical protein PtA15_10A505 [Puccinia triticina]|uniref:Uncharacterized protein n=1 Tax=Puccinia triticina TaxID=208348 RepID=A0ABY7D298_9BASI|nr:uncharacterized protein PtA15_10A505 [Puccinia triticina]WAQ89082.1 hypothetical protein PtA15_10A505 [Puccinia triticina]
MSAHIASVAEAPNFRGRQAKANKGHKMLTAGFRRLRTLSGVYYGRSSSDLIDQERPPVPALNRASSEQNQVPWPASSPVIPPYLSSAERAPDSGPLPPSLSHLRGIYFVPDANQDPDLDRDSSTNKSRPQSTESGTSLATPALEDISDCNASFAVSWSEQRDEDSSSSPNSLSTFEDSSTGTNDVSSVIGGVIKLICPANKTAQLSPGACQAAYPPIDLQSPYAPYAPTSPLSATSVHNSSSSSQNHTTNVSTFNIRMGLRPLPSIVTKPPAKNHAQSRQATQQQPGSSPASTLDIHHEQSIFSTQTRLPSPYNEKSSPIVSSPIHASGSDQCQTPKIEGRAGHGAEAATPRFGGFKEKLGFSGKPKHRYSRSASIGRPANNIPFPCSTHDDSEMAPKQRHERNCSEGAMSMLRGNLNQIWALPIQRIRTSSSISTIIRGMRSAKSTLRRSPSETSFEARPFSVRTESFYEILDPSAIPPCDSPLIPK